MGQTTTALLAALGGALVTALLSNRFARARWVLDVRHAAYLRAYQAHVAYSTRLEEYGRAALDRQRDVSVTGRGGALPPARVRQLLEVPESSHGRCLRAAQAFREASSEVFLLDERDPAMMNSNLQAPVPAHPLPKSPDDVQSFADFHGHLSKLVATIGSLIDAAEDGRKRFRTQVQFRYGINVTLGRRWRSRKRKMYDQMQASWRAMPRRWRRRVNVEPLARWLRRKLQ